MWVSRHIETDDPEVSNLGTAKLCYKARDHISNFYIYYHNYTISRITVIFTRVVSEPAHGNVCGPIPKYLDALALGFTLR